MSVVVNNPYDLCIVGAGLVGSSVARHASAKQGLSVCLIGPQEPKVIFKHSLYKLIFRCRVC